ncbi:MAG: MerR family transcriptional regulator [Patescibacteria group bacterium]|jgi:DNA-binding transcriptional MerR regulator
MFKIGQFSVITHLTIKTLRHYDELDLLKPAYVDENSGYRFYTGEQLPRVQKIISLKAIGFSLLEIAQLLEGDVSSEELVEKLEKKRDDEFNTLYPKMGELMIKQKLECIDPGYCFTLYHDGEYKETDIDVEICESVVKAGKDEDGMTFRKIPAVPQAACVIHQGPYTTIGKTYAALTKWIEDNGFEVTDLMRERYIDGIWNQEDPEKWITEIQAPIQKN